MRARKPFDVIYQSEDVIVVNKAPGILCIPPRHGSNRLSLGELLNKRFEKVWTVHRIDKDTSGVVLFALNEETHRKLSLLFQERSVQKTYLALTKGTTSNDEGTIDLPLSVSSRGKMRVDRSGKIALTDYKIVERFDGFGFIALQPKTGRQHQLRIHLKESGCPLIVDPLYAEAAPFTISQIKRRKFSGRPENEGTLLERTPLHAYKLQLPAGTLETDFFEAPLPKDMKACLSQLRKWRSN